MYKTDEGAAIPHNDRICGACQLRGLCLPETQNPELTRSIAPVINTHAPVPRGTYLFHQGAPMTAYYFLRSGSAKAIVDDGDGREVVLGFLFPTDLIGAGSMLRPIYYDSVVTLERSAFCMIEAKDLASLWRMNPAVHGNFLSKITNRIQAERHARIRLDHTTAGQRVADFILELSERIHRLGRDRDSLYLSMSRYDIGSHLDLAAETVSRILRRFNDAGYVEVKTKRVQIVDRAKLGEIAAGAAGV